MLFSDHTIAADVEQPTPTPFAQETTESKETSALVELLGSRDWKSPRLAKAIIDLVAGTGDVRATSLLMKLLQHPNPEVVGNALKALGKFKATESVETIVGLLKSDSVHIRVSAISALHGMGNPSAIEAIQNQLNDPAPEVRRAVIWSLGQAAREINSDTLQGLFEREEVATKLILLSYAQQTKSKALPNLIKMALANPTTDVRNKALSIMVEMRVPNIRVEDLAFLAKNNDPTVRQRLVSALTGAQGDVKPLFQELSHDKSSLVRQTVATSVGRLPFNEALELLKQLLVDPSSEVRRNALLRLGAFKRPEIIPLLTNATKDETTIVAATAAQILNQYKPQESVAAAATLYERADSFVKSSFLIPILAQSDNEYRRKVLPLAMQDENNSVRLAVVGQIDNLPSDLAFEIAQIAITDWHTPVRLGIVRFLSKVVDKPQALAYLKILQNDEDPNVSQVAIKSLQDK